MEVDGRGALESTLHRARSIASGENRDSGETTRLSALALIEPDRLGVGRGVESILGRSNMIRVRSLTFWSDDLDPSLMRADNLPR